MYVNRRKSIKDNLDATGRTKKILKIVEGLRNIDHGSSNSELHQLAHDATRFLYFVEIDESIENIYKLREEPDFITLHDLVENRINEINSSIAGSVIDKIPADKSTVKRLKCYSILKAILSNILPKDIYFISIPIEDSWCKKKNKNTNNNQKYPDVEEDHCCEEIKPDVEAVPSVLSDDERLNRFIRNIYQEGMKNIDDARASCHNWRMKTIRDELSDAGRLNDVGHILSQITAINNKPEDIFPVPLFRLHENTYVTSVKINDIKTCSILLQFIIKNDFTITYHNSDLSQEDVWESFIQYTRNKIDTKLREYAISAVKGNNRTDVWNAYIIWNIIEDLANTIYYGEDDQYFQIPDVHKKKTD